MKHFRDLVLSTKEPVLHNVLWIEPVRDEQTGKYILGKYQVKMFEDGWKILLGGGGEGSNGLGFRVVTILPNGDEIVQLYDTTDPNNPTKAYPITMATKVYLSNTVDVETAINNINNQLRNITSTVRKAIFATDDMIDGWEVSKAGKTFWVYDHTSSLNNNGYFTGEPQLRVYTSNSSYTTEQLYLSDIVMAIDDEVSGMQDTRMWYVNTIGGHSAQLIALVDFKDLIQLRNSLGSIYTTDIQVDGESVTSGNPKVAYLSDNVRPVYMVNTTNFETWYPTTNKIGKTFFFKEGTNNSGILRRYKTQTEYDEIVLKEGDLLYNMDSHGQFVHKTLYLVVKEGTDSGTVQPILNESYINQLIYNQVSEGIENSSDVYIDFIVTPTSEHTSGANTVWDVIENISDYDVEDIRSLTLTNRTVYARITGINNQQVRGIPSFIPLILCTNTNAKFAISGNGMFILEGAKSGQTVWQLTKTDVQSALTFDDVPTANSNNPVKSGGIYTALEDKLEQSDLDGYVLLNTSRVNYQKDSYSDRIAQTPKFHRAEWLDNTDTSEDGEYAEWDESEGEGYIDDSHSHYIDPSTQQKSAWGQFRSLWYAVMECNNTDGIAGAVKDEVPKLILRNGAVACYCTSDRLGRNDAADASEITLKFFDGTNVTTYLIQKKANDPLYGNCLYVKRTVQSVTLT